MKTVSIEEFRSHFEDYLAETEHGEILVTCEGRPWVILRDARQKDQGTDEEADLPAEFWEMIQQRRTEPAIPWEEARRSLEPDGE